MRSMVGCPGLVCVLVAMAASLVDCVSAETGRPGFILVEGNGVRACEDYVANLNAIRNQPNHILCERPVSADFPQLGKPHWEPVPMQEALEFVAATAAAEFDIELAARSRLTDQLRQQTRDRYRQGRIDSAKARAAAGNVKLARARFDIDNDGTPEDVVRYQRTARCPHEVGSIVLWILAGDGRSLDLVKSRLVGALGVGGGSGIEIRDDEGGYPHMDVFWHAGETYIDVRNLGQRTWPPKLVVFRAKDGRMARTCAVIDIRY